MGKSTISDESKGTRRPENQTLKENRKILSSGGGGGSVAKSCLNLGDPMDSSPPGFSAHDIS